LSLGSWSKIAVDGPFEAVLGKTRRTEFSLVADPYCIISPRSSIT
jgi:hypothetical protein